MGTVTLLFADIEGSTRLLRQLGSNDYGGLPTRHRAILQTDPPLGGIAGGSRSVIVSSH